MKRRDFLKLSVGGLILSQVPLVAVASKEIVKPKSGILSSRSIQILALPLEEYGNIVPRFTAVVEYTGGMCGEIDLHAIYVSDIQEYKTTELWTPSIKDQFLVGKQVTYNYFVDIALAVPSNVFFIRRLFAEAKMFKYQAKIIDNSELYAYIKDNDKNLVVHRS